MAEETKLGRPRGHEPVNYIYGLYDPDSGALRYIGKTNNPRRRIGQHVRDCRRGCSEKDRWVSALLSQGKRPELRILELANDWEEAERRLIAEHQDENLLNVASGGVPLWVDKARRSGKMHRRVMARLTEYANSATTEGKRAVFRDIAARYREARAEAIKLGGERAYEAHLSACFGGAL